jgi:nucleoside-diphosphate-sugar epimerase
MARWLVTGATGCVGRAVVAAALAAGHQVRGLARSGAPPGHAIEVLAGAVEDREAVARAVDGAEVVVHLAGWTHRDGGEAEVRRAIVDGTRQVAAAARAAGARLIAASSIAAGEDTPYGRAKRGAEAIVAELDPRAVCLRIALVHGPHDRGNVAALIRLVARGRAVIVGRGDNRKAMVGADNLADRIVLLGAGDLAGTFVAADGSPTQRELLETIAAALGRRPPPCVPLAAARAAARLLPAPWADRVDKLARDTARDGSPLDARLGYRPRVSFSDGIARAVAWVQTYG